MDAYAEWIAKLPATDALLREYIEVCSEHDRRMAARRNTTPRIRELRERRNLLRLVIPIARARDHNGVEFFSA